MFFFSRSDTPAVRAHLNAQTAFLNDMSKSLSRSFQEVCQLNIRLGQTMLEESTLIGQQLLTTERPTDISPLPPLALTQHRKSCAPISSTCRG